MSEISKALKSIIDAAPVQSALNLVKTSLDKTIEIQKELVLIESPTGHEAARAQRYMNITMFGDGFEEVKEKEIVFSWKDIWILSFHSEMLRK